MSIFNILMEIESSRYLLFLCVFKFFLNFFFFFLFLTKTSDVYSYSNILGEARLLDISPF